MSILIDVKLQRAAFFPKVNATDRLHDMTSIQSGLERGGWDLKVPTFYGVDQSNYCPNRQHMLLCNTL